MFIYYKGSSLYSFIRLLSFFIITTFNIFLKVLSRVIK